MKYKIPFIRPDFPSEADIADDYSQILRSNWFTNFGPFERKFSEGIAKYIGSGYVACTFSSATSALIASVIAIFGKGDSTKYVLMPSFTFPAGAEALEWCGFQPLFVDIEEEGLHMDLTAARKILEDKRFSSSVVGILFCNAFGVGSEKIRTWEELAKELKLPLIIDSAAGFGSLYSEGHRVGSAGDCEIFSFHATKPFAIGEGGAVVSKNKKLIDTLISIQNFGFADNKGNVTKLGFNGKLQEINAAIGLHQLERFEMILRERRKVHARYKAELHSKFRLQANAHYASLCFAAVIVEDASDRDKHLSNLVNAGVEVKTYYCPSLHRQTYFASIETPTPLRVTEKVDASVLSLPIHDRMKQQDIDLIINVLNKG
jgi:dTDP-4-amino-4,6-dideoxygalactose transaminase